MRSLRDAVRVAAGRVDLHRDERVAELAAQGLEALGGTRRVGGEPQPEHARAVGGTLLHSVEVGVADADGRLALAAERETAATAG